MTKEQAMSLLEITNVAFTPEELKKAYRMVSRKYHPDLHPNDASAANMMALINEAEAFLSNPDNNKRLKVTHRTILDIVCC